MIFAGARYFGPADAGRYEITVSDGHVANMAWQFEQTWLRPPTAAELDALIDEYVREEVLYREAVAAGLHENDQVVRRRMGQQIEALTRDVVDAMEPSDETLNAWLGEHAERFLPEPRLTFEQQYLGAGLASLPGYLEHASLRQVEREFGAGFAAALASRSAGWEGQVESGFGPHQVRVIAVEQPALPELEAIRADVEADWRAGRTRELDDRYYAQLRSKYSVERPGH